MPRQIQGSQTDFSFGEVDIALKRADDHPARKAGLRQMANARILNAGGAQNRSGRRPIFPIQNGATRVEKITMSAGNNFKIGFGNGNMQIVSSTGIVLVNFTTQGNGAALPWVTANVNTIVYAIFGLKIYVTFGHAMVPQVITWDGSALWTIADYAELVFGNQKRTPFYRISPQGITMLPSGRTGAVTLTMSDNVFVAQHVGTRMRFIGRQLLITAVADAKHATATVMESLPGHQNFGLSVDPRPSFSLGDIVTGKTSGSKGLVTALSAGGMDVQLMTVNATTISVNPSLPFGGDQRTVSFTNGETIVGPAGSIVLTSAGPIDDPTIGVALWDEEVMNGYQGYPGSVFTDQFRVGFADFPNKVQGGISWSAINSPLDLYVGANPGDAMFEIAPGKVRVLYVVPGPESSEFVFCDTRLYYIPISPTNPLKPGSVQFQVLSSDGCAQVQPRITQELILYVNAGGNSVMAILASGAYYRPFNTKNLSDFHAHLFTNIVAIAVPTADNTFFNERYAYVLNANGSLVVGKYTLDNVTTSMPKIGWGPWSGTGVVSWVDAWNGEVHFTSNYFGIALIYEILDDAQYLDAALAVNALPAAFTPPGGKGPLWFIPSQSVTLIDQVTRFMGTYQIDANGFIIPQNNGGENLLAASLVAGQPWTMTIEPFAPDATSGADMGQRMRLRQIANLAVYVINSTGFYFASLFSAKQTPTSPPLGRVEQICRIEAWNQGDDPTKPPTQRETVEMWPPPGSSYDPRAAIIKDTPGPLLIAEIGMEISL